MKRVREDGGVGAGGKRAASNTAMRGQAASAMQSTRLTTNDALTYLREVKNRFQDNKEVYDTFLEIMKEFKAQRIDTAGVIGRVKDLFRGHKELILGFNTFLPKGYEISMQDIEEDERREAATKQPAVEFDQAITYVNKIKQRFATDERVYKAFLEILNMYRKGQKTIQNVYEEVAVLFRHHNDLLGEFTYFLPDNTPPIQGQGQQHPAFQNARNAMRANGGMGNRAQGGARPGQMRGPYGTAQPMYSSWQQQQKPMRRFRDENEQRAALDKELLYFERVKAQLRNREAYVELLKCLHMFSQDIISKNELLSLVHDIIGKTPSLMTGFHTFLNRCEQMDIDIDIGRLVKGREYNRIKAGGYTNREKFLSKPLSEIAADLASSGDRCTTSYVRTPSGYPTLKCSGRNDLCNEVLNDTWVSIISGSEDYSFKLMRKNQYEESLFRCEDDRYELDMCIETNASTIRALRPIADKLAAMNPDDKANYRLEEDKLSPVHFRAIERLYGDTGGQLLDLLRKNPAVAINVVLMRLEQKDAEWRRVREEMQKLWLRVIEQNYHRSLDHRSFYFKQWDKRNLVPRIMVAEIKEIYDRRRDDDQSLINVATGCPVERQLQPDLSYSYPDRAVHEDCFKVVAAAVEEYCSADCRDQVMELYVTFMEPFFGLPVRQYTQVHKHRAEPMATDGGAAGGATTGADTDGAARDSDSDSDDKEKTGKGLSGARAPPAGDTTYSALTPGMTPEPEPLDVANDPMGALLSVGQQQDQAISATAAVAAAGSGVEDGEMEDGEVADGDGAPFVSRQDADEDESVQEAEEEEPADTDKDGTKYMLCRPLSSSAPLTSSLPSPTGAVLYGNETFYTLFRYHRYLYDRLEVARRCCREKVKQSGSENKEAATEETKAAAAAENADKLHERFLGMLLALMDPDVPEMDSGSYEDACRSLLGTGSYVLFTLDKLLHKLVKHIQALLQEEPSVRLLELFKYESRRATGICDQVYFLNASAILQEGDLYRLSHVPGAAPTAARLEIQMMECSKEEKLAAPGPAFMQYVKGFIYSPAGANTGDIFLQRNLRGINPDDDEAVMAALTRLCIANGLEVKLSAGGSRASRAAAATSTSPVSYVLDTQDVMFKRSNKPPRRAYRLEARRGKAMQWMTSRGLVPAPEYLAYMATCGPQQY